MVKCSRSVGLTMTSLLLLTPLHVTFMQGHQEYLHHNTICSTSASSAVEKFSQKYTELHWSKGTLLLTFHSLQIQPAHTRAAHRLCCGNLPCQLSTG